VTSSGGGRPQSQDGAAADRLAREPARFLVRRPGESTHSRVQERQLLAKKANDNDTANGCAMIGCEAVKLDAAIEDNLKELGYGG